MKDPGMMGAHKSARNSWTSPWTFVFAATGVAVGLGNIWRFPYLLDVYGPSFLWAYFVMLVFFGFPLLYTEVRLGQRRDYWRADPVFNPPYRSVEHLSVTVALAVMALYSVVGGMGYAFLFFSAFGNFVGATPQEMVSIVSVLQWSPRRLFWWVTVFILLVVLVSYRGAGRGIGRALTLIMPMFFLCLLGLVTYAWLSLDSDAAWHRFVARPFFEPSIRLWVDAAMQCFYSLAVGMGAMLIYGRYTPEETRLAPYVLLVVVLDATASLLASVFLLTIQADSPQGSGSGFGLVFFTLPLALGKLSDGQWVGTLFFLMIGLAAWSSAIGVFEALVFKAQERFGWTRQRAVVLAGLACWLLGGALGASLNLGKDLVLLGHNLLGWWSAMTSMLLIPCVVIGVLRVHWLRTPRRTFVLAGLFTGVGVVFFAGLLDFAQTACERSASEGGWLCQPAETMHTPEPPPQQEPIRLRDDLLQDSADNDALPQWPLGEEEQ